MIEQGYGEVTQVIKKYITDVKEINTQTSLVEDLLENVKYIISLRGECNGN